MPQIGSEGFEFAVLGTPASAQSKGRKKDAYKQRVAEAARTATRDWSEPDAAGSTVSVWMVYFYLGDTNLDVDNFIKPTLDAMCEVLYRDDRQVVQVLARKTRIDDLVVVSLSSPALADALREKRDFVLIGLGEAPDHQEMPR